MHPNMHLVSRNFLRLRCVPAYLLVRSLLGSAGYERFGGPVSRHFEKRKEILRINVIPVRSAYFNAKALEEQVLQGLCISGISIFLPVGVRVPLVPRYMNLSRWPIVVLFSNSPVQVRPDSHRCSAQGPFSIILSGLPAKPLADPSFPRFSAQA